MSKKTLQIQVKSERKLVLTQFERTVRDKIDCQTHLESENYCFKDIFGIAIKFTIQWHKKH